jgi:hypothetical protein
MGEVSSSRTMTPKLTVKVVLLCFKIFSGSRDSIEKRTEGKRKKGFCMENQTRKKDKPLKSANNSVFYERGGLVKNQTNYDGGVR